MKLDKIRFASLIGFISCRYALTVTQDDMREMDEIIDVEVPVSVTPRANQNDVNTLMRAIHAGEKINSIKAYRDLTGCGLKESKDEVERHWELRRTKQECYDKLATLCKDYDWDTEKHNEYSKLINMLF